MTEKQIVTLESLVGPHMLSGVQPGVRPKAIDDRYGEDANTLTVVLDGIAYAVVEDPDDGYRSSMGDIQIVDVTEVTNTFAPVAVIAAMRDPQVSKYQVDDVLDVTDVATGKIVLSLGTGNTHDYYPYFVADWSPENLSLNASVEQKGRPDDR